MGAPRAWSPGLCPQRSHLGPLCREPAHHRVPPSCHSARGTPRTPRAALPVAWSSGSGALRALPRGLAWEPSSTWVRGRHHGELGLRGAEHGSGRSPVPVTRGRLPRGLGSSEPGLGTPHPQPREWGLPAGALSTTREEMGCPARSRPCLPQGHGAASPSVCLRFHQDARGNPKGRDHFQLLAQGAPALERPLQRGREWPPDGAWRSLKGQQRLDRRALHPSQHPWGGNRALVAVGEGCRGTWASPLPATQEARQPLSLPLVIRSRLSALAPAAASGHVTPSSPEPQLLHL